MMMCVMHGPYDLHLSHTVKTAFSFSVILPRSVCYQYKPRQTSVVPILYCSRFQKTLKSMTQKLVQRLQDIRSEVSALRKENRELKSFLQKVKDEVAAHKSSEKNDT